MKEYIPIPKHKIEETKIACINELHFVQSQREHNPFRTVLLFLSNELNNFWMITFIGALIIIGSRFLIHMHEYLTITILVYLFIVVIVGLFEIYKNMYYQMNELLSTTMISPSKAIAYKTISILLIEICMFVVLILTCGDVIHIDIKELYLYLLFPSFITSILSLLLMKYIQSGITSIVLNIAIYSVIALGFSILRIGLLLTNFHIVIATAIMILTYIFVAIYLIKNDRGVAYGI